MSQYRALLIAQVLAQPHGGVLRHAREALPRLAAQWLDRGHSLTLLEGSTPLDVELPSAVRREASKSAPVKVRDRAFKEGRWVRRAIEDLGPFDLVHTAHLPVPRLPGPTRLCWLVHDLRRSDARVSGRLGSSIGRRWLKQAAARAHGVLCVSRQVRDRLENEFEVPRQRLFIARHGGDHLPILPRSLDDGRGQLLYVGHLEPRKNLTVLLRALGSDPQLPPLRLVGRDVAGHTQQLKTLSVSLGIADRVHFEEPVPDARLPELYARAAALVLPSKLEGFGLPVIEAQRAGVPVAVARAGALTEVGGPFAASFDPDNPEACARALRVSLARPQSELELAARRARGFKWDLAATRWREAWEAILAAPST